jgi:hypothetical protein
MSPAPALAAHCSRLCGETGALIIVSTIWVYFAGANHYPLLQCRLLLPDCNAKGGLKFKLKFS